VENRPQQDHIKDATSPKQRRRFARALRLLIIITLTYAGVSVCVGVFQTKLIYFPSRDYDWTPTDVGLDYENLTLTTRDGVSIAAWYITNEPATRTILFCHGNAGNMSDRMGSVKALHRLGYHVLIFDYRGYGRSEGRPNEPGTYADAEAAWDYLVKTRGEPRERVVLFGRSLGGGVAIHLASRLADDGPAALVVESTFTSLVDVGSLHYPILPVSLLLTNRYDSISKIGEVGCPKLFIHGTDDELIPIEMGLRLFDAALEPKLFMETPGGHNSAGFTYSPAFAEQLAKFLSANLSGP
jgi:fermentation-respiration switch protein FrsA (DUF1100 family)